MAKKTVVSEIVEDSPLMDNENADGVMEYADSEADFADVVEEAVPEADLVFDGEVSEKWLGRYWERRTGAFRSIRFEPEFMDTTQVIFLLELARRAIVKTYKPYHFLPNLERGVLYVPEELAAADVLLGMERGEQVGKYVAFRIP